MVDSFEVSDGLGVNTRCSIFCMKLFYLYDTLLNQMCQRGLLVGRACQSYKLSEALLVCGAQPLSKRVVRYNALYSDLFKRYKNTLWAAIKRGKRLC